MRKKWLAQVMLFTLLAGATAMCAKDELEDETEDVLQEQREAAEAAAEDPTDTARIRDEANDVIEEQREAADAMRDEVEDRGLDTVRSTTRE